ncbi:mitochondrial import inner membrane translocase subunit TIM22-4-like [Curcuma longa]|uniref:mitochondrial import inner membrane translocase subunit TIM22-4-like n=1 Tax=Curcuma longa TaxID=136217 RepID=UPI003D9E8BF8
MKTLGEKELEGMEKTDWEQLQAKVVAMIGFCLTDNVMYHVMDEESPMIREVLFVGLSGGGLGFFMGMFLGALDNPIMQEEMTTKQQLIFQAKQMGRRSISSAKAFGLMGLIFSAAECVVEKARAKHDTTNTVVAGCVTGGAISTKGSFSAFKNRTSSL